MHKYKYKYPICFNATTSEEDQVAVRRRHWIRILREERQAPGADSRTPVSGKEDVNTLSGYLSGEERITFLKPGWDHET